jgi:hypothetical protein
MPTRTVGTLKTIKHSYMSFSAVLLPATTITASGATDVIPGVPGIRGALFIVNVLDKSGTSPTLDLKLQVQNPATGGWVDLTGATFTQITNTTTQQALVYPMASGVIYPTLPANCRVYYTLGGSANPTFTGVSISINYLS